MESSQKRLLKKLAKGLAKEIDANISNKKLKQCFEQIIENLPSGSDVKEGLTEHHHLCLKFFIRYFRRACRKPASSQDIDGSSVSEAADLDQISASERHHLFWRLPSRLPDGLPQNAQLQFIVQQLHREKNLDKLSGIVDNLETCKGLFPGGGNFSKLFALTAGSQDVTVLKKIMHLQFNALRDEIEAIVASKSQERAKQHEQELCTFLHMCHLRRLVCVQDTTVPSYADLLASLLSLYLDLFLVSHGNEPAEKKEQRRLCSMVHHLMAGCGARIFDVFLQVTAAGMENANWLLPLLRRILNEKPDQRSCEHYLCFILTVRMWSRLLKLEEIAMEARLVRAPKGFITWLLKRNPSLADELPTDRKFKGHIVTSFLLDDAEDNIHDMLLDILTYTASGQEIVKHPDDGLPTMAETVEVGVDDGKMQTTISVSDDVNHLSNDGAVQESRSLNKKKTTKKAEISENGSLSQKTGLFFMDRAGEGPSMAISMDLDSERKLKKKKKQKMDSFEKESANLSAESLENLGTMDSTQTADSSVPDIFTIDRKGRRDGQGTNSEELSSVKKKKKSEAEPVSDGLLHGTETGSSTPAGMFFVDRSKRRYSAENDIATGDKTAVRQGEKVGKKIKETTEVNSHSTTSLPGRSQMGKRGEGKDTKNITSSVCKAEVEQIWVTQNVVLKPSSLFVIDRGGKGRGTNVAKYADFEELASEKQQGLQELGQISSDAVRLEEVRDVHTGILSSPKSEAADVKTRHRAASEKSATAETVVAPTETSNPLRVVTRSRTLSERSSDTPSKDKPQSLQQATAENEPKRKQKTLPSGKRKKKDSGSVIPPSVKSLARKDISGTESESLEDDFRILTDSNTNTGSPAVLPDFKKPLLGPGESLSASPHKLTPTLPHQVSDIGLVSEASSDGDDISKRVNKLGEKLAAMSPLSSSVVDNYASEESLLDGSAVPNLKVHLKTKSPQRWALMFKQTDSSASEVDGKTATMKKRKFESVFPLSQDDHADSAAELLDTPFSLEFEISNGTRGDANRGLSCAMSDKRASSEKTVDDTAFTEAKPKRGKSVTPVARRTQSHNQEGAVTDTPKSMSEQAGQQSAGEKEVAPPPTIVDATRDMDEDSEQTLPQRKKKETKLEDGTLRSMRGSMMPLKKLQASGLANISKKAGWKKSAVTTSLAAETRTPKKTRTRRNFTSIIASEASEPAKENSLKDRGQKLGTASEYAESGTLSSEPGDSGVILTWKAKPPQKSFRSRKSRLSEPGHEEMMQTSQAQTPQKMSSRSPRSKPIPKAANSPSQNETSEQLLAESSENSDSGPTAHEIETRSKSAQKGYNLRSSKFK